MTSLTNLPEDVLINKILLKSDANSLVNLKCVCKNFRSFITNPDFVKMHCHDQSNNNNNPLVLVYLKKNLFCSLTFNGTDIFYQSLPERVEISTPFRLPWFIGSCNGLLCLVDKVEIDQNPCLWNPSTKEYKKLPPPLPALAPVEDPALLTHYFTYGFGYDSIIDDYKVIQCENLSYCHNSMTEFQVYTLGTDTWRKIDNNPYESYCMIHYRYHSSGMFVNGAVHWFGWLDSQSRIIAFDIEKEMFRAEVPIPRSRLISQSSNMCSLDVLRGCLCIYQARIEHEVDNWVRMDIWMMKEYGVMDSWTKLFKIKDSYAFQYPSMYDFKVLKFCESGEFLVSMKPRDDHKVLILYDPINKKRRKVEFGKTTSFKGCMEIHIQSLVSLKTGIYMGRVKKQVLEGKTEDEYASEEEEDYI